MASAHKQDGMTRVQNRVPGSGHLVRCGGAGAGLSPTADIAVPAHEKGQNTQSVLLALDLRKHLHENSDCQVIPRPESRRCQHLSDALSFQECTPPKTASPTPFVLYDDGDTACVRHDESTERDAGIQSHSVMQAHSVNSPFTLL
jgi:hypothetical protein